MSALMLLLAACNLQADAELTPVATPDLPRVEFLYPDPSSIVIEGTDLTLDIVAYDETAGVARIDVLVDDVSLIEITPPDGISRSPFRVETNWFAEGIGRHSISAIPYRADGTRGDDVILIVEVQARQ